MSRILLTVALVPLLGGLYSCVYYNTFYNAKRYFREGVKENEDNETGRPKTASYQKSIDSAARILEYYPQSKYVDDALLLMGKAYYEIHTYPKAKQKFEELLTIYPDSPLRDEARLYLGKTLIAMRRPEEGSEVLIKLWSEKTQEDIRIKSQQALADHHFEQQSYRQALLEYQKILEISEDKRQRAEMWFQIGECYFNLGDYQQAEVAYSNVLKQKPTRKLEFDAILKRAMTLRMRGDLEAALAICENLLKKDIYFNYFDQAQLLKAEILDQLERSQEAEELYKRIIELYPRTATSAKASFRLGQIYLKEMKDFTKAEEYLMKVRQEFAQSEFAEEAQAQVNDLRFLKSVNHSIDSLNTDIDTLNYQLSWLAKKAAGIIDSTAIDSVVTPDTTLSAPELESPPPAPIKGDSVMVPPKPFMPGRPEFMGRQEMEYPPGYVPPHPGSESERPSMVPGQPGVPQRRAQMLVLPTDSSEIYDRLERDQEDLAGLLFRLAEHLRIQFDDVDSARVLLSDLTQEQDFPEVQARSLLSLYQLEKNVSPDSTGPDSLLVLVHEQFPGTEFDQWARKKLGLEPLPEQVDSAAEAFYLAEDLWTSLDLPADAVKEYRRVYHLYPDSEWGAKALYASAWLQEHVLKNIPDALASYDTLVTRFPDSPYFAIAEKKIAPPPPELPDTTEAGLDTTEVTEIAGATETVPQGSAPPTIIGGDEVLLDHIHKNHLYPTVAQEAGVPGEVLVRFTVSAQGIPENFEILREDPEGFDFGVMAIRALQGMAFRPGYSEGQYIDAPLTQLVRFVP